MELLVNNQYFKQCARKLLELLQKQFLLVTFEYSKIYWIQFEMKNTICTALVDTQTCTFAL